MAKKEKKPAVSLVTGAEGIPEIHVMGSTLSNATYLEILMVIKELGIHARKVFVVKTPVMMRLIHDCIPREYYEKIALTVEYDGEEFRRYAG